MLALRQVSIYIFNSMSRAVHKRRGIVGHPYQMSYPLPVTKSTFGMSHWDYANERNVNEFSKYRVQTQSVIPVKSKTKSSTLRRSIPPSSFASISSAHSPALIYLEEDTFIGEENEENIKTFVKLFEEELLRKLTPIEGVGAPLSHPPCLENSPKMRISHTYAAKLRQLYNETCTHCWKCFNALLEVLQ